MGTEFVTGDLFKQYDVGALAHGVNCRGIMGAGIAPVFKDKWPLMYQEYRTLCLKRTLRPGLVYPYYTDNGKWIYNMATQDDPGRNATYEWLEISLRFVRLHAETHRIRSVAMPRIGAGIGGLNWTAVKNRMTEVFEGSQVILRAVSLPDS